MLAIKMQYWRYKSKPWHTFEKKKNLGHTDSKKVIVNIIVTPELSFFLKNMYYVKAKKP